VKDFDLDFKFKDIVESANDIIIVTKPVNNDVTKQTIVYVNSAFTRLTGYSSEEVVGKTSQLLELFKDEVVRKDIEKKLTEKMPVKRTIETTNKSGETLLLDLSMLPLKDDNGEGNYFVSIERDITKEKSLFIELEKLSKTDPLTGLSNRRELIEYTEIEFARANRENKGIYILIIDLDYFKKINDTYGHSVGDRVLIEVSKALSSQTRIYDMAARIGGEEFCVLLSKVEHKFALQAAERIRKSISDIVVYDDDENLIKITASIGVAYNQPGESVDSVIKHADTALYQAKAKGRNCVVEYQADKKT
jgi:diguanylate cyclase (GGDEF)-like protein/PAS domain S-box-containing protein